MLHTTPLPVWATITSSGSAAFEAALTVTLRFKCASLPFHLPLFVLRCRCCWLSVPCKSLSAAVYIYPPEDLNNENRFSWPYSHQTKPLLIRSTLSTPYQGMSLEAILSAKNTCGVLVRGLRSIGAISCTTIATYAWLTGVQAYFTFLSLQTASFGGESS
jgi:hypothetical protein